MRLLRVLEDGQVVPVGSTKEHKVDFRLVCASSRDLEQAAGESQSNQALLYRILVVSLRLPPLRQRREDLPLLLDHFLGQACLLARRTRRFSPELRQGEDGQAEYYLRRLEGLPGRRVPELAQALAAAHGGELANRDLRQRLGCSDSTVKNLCKVLAQAGLLTVIGDRGGHRYLVNEPEEE